MFSEAQFRKWQASVAAQDDARIRADIAAEFAEHDRLTSDAAERERGARGAAQSLRFADRLPGMAGAPGARLRDATRTDAERAAEREAARRAEIRSGVEAEMRRWDRERQLRETPATQRRSAPAGTGPQTTDFGGNRYAVEGTRWRLLGPSPATRQVPSGTRVGEIRTVQGFRYRWDGRAWLDGEGRPMPLAAA